MGTTPNFQLPYPEGGDPADGPDGIRDLADAVDATVKGQTDSLASRIATLESQVAALSAVGAQPGDFLVSGRATTPSGYLLCDGAAVSRTTYAALFAAISTDFGPGDGASTFNLPDYRGRTIVGVGPHADVNARGKSDGLLAANRRPKHRSSVNETPHNHPDAGHSHPGAWFKDQVGPTGRSSADTPGGNNDMRAMTTAGANLQPAATGLTVGPQTGAEPIDTPAFQTANVFVKT
jgi:microcystin-dependent protein